MSPHNGRAEEPWRVELPELRRGDTTDCCDSMRRRIKQPDPAVVRDWSMGRSSAAPLCEGARRRAGIIGIEMPTGLIEHLGPRRRRIPATCPHDRKNR